MFQGVLRHCTEMEIDRQYVDSHGQSAVAFDFCRLLGFELMPWIRGINRQKPCKVQAGQSFPNSDPIMALRPRNWELIEEQLDTMVPKINGRETVQGHVSEIMFRTLDTRKLLQRGLGFVGTEFGVAAI